MNVCHCVDAPPPLHATQAASSGSAAKDKAAWISVSVAPGHVVTFTSQRVFKLQAAAN